MFSRKDFKQKWSVLFFWRLEIKYKWNPLRTLPTVKPTVKIFLFFVLVCPCAYILINYIQLFWSIKTTSYNHLGGGMFIHFSEREMYIRGGVISKTGRNVCPEFPRNVNGNWGKCMKPKGEGAPVYTFLRGWGSKMYKKNHPSSLAWKATSRNECFHTALQTFTVVSILILQDQWYSHRPCRPWAGPLWGADSSKDQRRLEEGNEKGSATPGLYWTYSIWLIQPVNANFPLRSVFLMMLIFSILHHQFAQIPSDTLVSDSMTYRQHHPQCTYLLNEYKRDL